MHAGGQAYNQPFVIGPDLTACACAGRFKVDCRECVSSCHIRWLGFTAFRRVLGRKQARRTLQSSRGKHDFGSYGMGGTRVACA